MEVAKYTINVCSLVGLGVAIDCSLFIVVAIAKSSHRFRNRTYTIARAVSECRTRRCIFGCRRRYGPGRPALFSRLVPLHDGHRRIDRRVSLRRVRADIFAGDAHGARPEDSWARFHAVNQAIQEKRGARFPTSSCSIRCSCSCRRSDFCCCLDSHFCTCGSPPPDVRVLDRTSEARRAYDRFRRDFPDASGESHRRSRSFSDCACAHGRTHCGHLRSLP